MQARPQCRLCLVVTADEVLARDAQRATPPNAWVVVVCAPEALAEILDSFQVRHIVLDARYARGPELHAVLMAKARSIPISRTARRDSALALLSKICAEADDRAGAGERDERPARAAAQ